MNKQVFKIKLKKGDTVVVRTGKYKGKTGKVVMTHPTDNKVTVEGINIVKRHIKPNRQHPQGDIIELTKPIFISKVAIQDPTSKKASKISMKIDSKGIKSRSYKNSGKEIK
ncbi:50S ribosomal protein L24 [Candidatus Saccharibacteria bacterium]|nr:50S ribosomal protein L24 [Candidatus Saccharibacteria bacterium]